METFLLVVTLLINGNVEKHVVDYNLTLEDCQSRTVIIDSVEDYKVVSVSCVNSEFYDNN